MVIPVPQQADRDNLVAYFTAVHDGTAPAAPRAAAGPGAGAPPPASLSQAKADWKKDAPGVVHSRGGCEVARAGCDRPSASNFPSVVPKPEGAKLKLPPGFKVEV